MKSRTLLTSAKCMALVTLLGGCQVGGSTVTDREGYYTWVDEQGHVRYSPTHESVRQAPVQTAARSEMVPHSQGEIGNVDAESEYTLENYPDADQLAKDGYVRPGEKPPYFTWRDAQGTVRVSYYRPDTRTDVEKGFTKPPAELSSASVYLAGSIMVPVAPVEGQDPDAFAILGIESSPEDVFAQFSEFCCEDIETRDHEEWVTGREFGIAISNESPAHNFLTGESPFQLIALSSVIGHPDFIMQLRSYANKGVFVPSLAFLDRDFVPVRLVTDLVSSYVPENWHRRGYLEAWVPVFPEQGERWLIVYTRTVDLEGREVVETKKGPKVIPHTATGELGFMMVE
jgi:hypothetical protein